MTTKDMPGIADEYQLGNIFWAKVGSHPWWPCMIYHPPDGDAYVKEKGRSFLYHVQFLGPLVERAWVSPSSMIPFMGKKAFDEYVQDKLRTCKDKAERAKFDSRCVANNKSIWIQSWKEAESAIKLSTDQRIEKFGRISVKSKSRRISKDEEGELLELMSNVPLTIEEEAESLSTFLQSELEVRMKNNPEIDRKSLEEELRTQWPALDIATKRKYIQDQLGIFDDALQKLEKHHRKCKENALLKTESTKQSENNRIPGSKHNRKSEHSSKSTSEGREFDIEIHRLIVSPAQYRLQPVCPVCEVYSSAPGQMFQCRGPCGRVVHPRCMRYKNPPPPDNSRVEKFRCPQCLSGEFLCSVCGKPGENESKTGIGPLFVCQVINCGRHFHRDCLVGWPGILTRPSDSVGTRLGAFQILRCPAHTCNTCYLESSETDRNLVSKKSTVIDGPLLQCVRCPAVFHTGDLCTPAGSVEVSLSHIVCPRHFDLTLINLTNFKTQHPNWCFHCYKSMAERVDCHFCPTTYHKTCLEQSFGHFIDDKFICRSCQRGMFPRYAQIIWAKIPQFRWWPCEIIHARNAPINILNMAHPEGSFPVHFLGSDEYQWISRNRVFPYETGLKTSAAKEASGSNKIEKAFNRSLNRAPKAHALYVNHVIKRGLPLNSMCAEELPENELLPPNSLEANRIIDPNADVKLANELASFTLIQANIYSDDCLEILESMKNAYAARECCTCASNQQINNTDEDRKAPVCSANNKCSNVLEKFECNSKLCSLTEGDCGNRPFLSYSTNSSEKSAKNNASFSVYRTINRGYALKSLTEFHEGDLVLEFVGELINLDEANRRIIEALGPNALSCLTSSRKEFQPLSNTRLLRCGKQCNLVLDAYNQGNLSRFINHACEPNLVSECWIVEGFPRVGLFAKKSISPNDELTLNYLTSEFLSTGLMGAYRLCLCGGDFCLSTLHLPTSFQPYEVENETSESSSVTKEKRKFKKLDETFAKSEEVSIAVPANINDEITKSKAAFTRKSPERSRVSVSSLLAAAASQAAARRDRGALISPAVAAARASMSSKQKVVAERNKTASIESIENMDTTLVGLRPPLHEDFCYRCGDGGELVLCDKSTCSKSYHLNCLGLSVPPTGIWYCPWHYCDLCGHPSTHLCWRCPNSYCNDHAQNEKHIKIDDLDLERWQLAKASLNIVTNSTIISSVRWICADHDGLKIYGPGNKPRLSFDPDQSLKSELEINNQLINSNCNDTAINAESMKTISEERENIVPLIASKCASTNTNISKPEPFKVTLKRKLKAEMAAKQSNQVSAEQEKTSLINGENNTATTSISTARRRSVTCGSGPTMDKKRSKLSKETPSKL